MTNHPIQVPAEFIAYLATPEVRLLVTCCRIVLGVAEDGEMDAALAHPFDEEKLEQVCQVHRLVVLVNRTLVRRRPDHFSPALRQRFEHHATTLGLAHLRMCKSVVDIHREFGGRGVGHVFLKGPVLGRLLFGGEYVRYSGDLDVLADPRDFPAVHEGMLRLGFHPYLLWWQRRFGLSLRFTHRKDMVYVHPTSGIYVELHWKLDEVEPFLNGFDWDAEAAATREFHGEQVPVFPASRDFLYLCFHAAKHHWERFQWLLDIAMLVRRADFNGEEVLALAERQGLTGVVEEALRMARIVFGVEAPSVAGRTMEAAGARAARRFVMQHFGPGPLLPLLRTWHGSFLYPRVSQRLRFWLDRLTEWSFVKIPRLPHKADEGRRRP